METHLALAKEAGGIACLGRLSYRSIDRVRRFAADKLPLDGPIPTLVGRPHLAQTVSKRHF